MDNLMKALVAADKVLKVDAPENTIRFDLTLAEVIMLRSLLSELDHSDKNRECTQHFLNVFRTTI